MLEEIFGDYPKIKVLDYLLMNPFGTYTKQQIAVGAEISRITLNNFIEEIIERNILIKDSNSRLSLNLDSPIVKILNRIIDDLNKIKIDEEMENHDESYDILDDDELDVVFDENASDVDLDQLEQEITFTEYESLKIEYVEENSTNFKLAFCE
ncbi:hypothetical protein [uncultured Methanobrevibacter sp.]|uniref:hypothetical protein n=1 Tax=uncultured Methanobrevibacter sp. TaxID=253161 RepID=UPI002604AF5E|nr:hypothetical protein [uncultured Methanobrevibacter sp.]